MVNGGVNGALSWNVLSRLPNVIACRPHVVILLVGTNDARGVYDPQGAGSLSVKKYGLPRMPSRKFFSESLEEILKQIRDQTMANGEFTSLYFSSFCYERRGEEREREREWERERRGEYSAFTM